MAIPRQRIRPEHMEPLQPSLGLVRPKRKRRRITAESVIYGFCVWVVLYMAVQIVRMWVS